MKTIIKNNASPLMVMLAFATVYIVWGSTYFFIQKAMTGFPPFLLGALRFLIAGAIMLAWAMMKGEKVFDLKEIKTAGIAGILMLFGGTGAVIWVEQYLPSGMVAIMVSSGPLWFILLDKPNWAENFKSKLMIGGLIIGFAGIVLLFYPQLSGAFKGVVSKNEVSGIILLIIGSITWAAGSLYSKYKSAGKSVTVTIAWQMLAAGIAFIPGSYYRNEIQTMNWQSISIDAWLSLWYLILLGSIAAFTAYVWLLTVRSATQVSTHAYVNPVVAVLLGVFFADENISMIQITGLVIILSSVLMVNLVKYRKTKPAMVVEERKSIIKPVVITKEVQDLEV